MLMLFLCYHTLKWIRNKDFVKVKKQNYPVTGRRGLYGYDMLRIPQCLDSRLTDGGEVISFTSQQRFTPMKIPSTHFC
jgi:hypothetical protein